MLASCMEPLTVLQEAMQGLEVRLLDLPVLRVFPRCVVGKSLIALLTWTDGGSGIVRLPGALAVKGIPKSLASCMRNAQHDELQAYH